MANLDACSAALNVLPTGLPSMPPCDGAHELSAPARGRTRSPLPAGRNVEPLAPKEDRSADEDKAPNKADLRASRDGAAPSVRGWGSALLLALIRFYQLAISPWLGRGCRFEPSCSRYAAVCIASHGAAHGSLLSLKRLCKCHPFHPGGFDPPPAPPPRRS